MNKRICALTLGLLWKINAFALTFVPGDFYASNGWELGHYSATGTLLESMSLSSGGRRAFGIAFRDDKSIFVLTDNISGETSSSARIEVLDSSGSVLSTFSAGGQISHGNLGNLKFDASGEHLFISTYSGFNRVKVDGTGAQLVAGPGYSVTPLPDGRILTQGDDRLYVYSKDGTLMTTIGSVIDDPLDLIDNQWSMNYLMSMRGAAFDANSNTLYVNALGYSGLYGKVFAFDGLSAKLKAIGEYGYAADMVVAPDGTLLVGSTAGSFGIMGMTGPSLSLLSTAQNLPGGNFYPDGQKFVAIVPVPSPIPEPNTLALWALGLLIFVAGRGGQFRRIAQ